MVFIDQLQVKIMMFEFTTWNWFLLVVTMCEQQGHGRDGCFLAIEVFGACIFQVFLTSYTPGTFPTPSFYGCTYCCTFPNYQYINPEIQPQLYFSVELVLGGVQTVTPPLQYPLSPTAINAWFAKYCTFFFPTNCWTQSCIPPTVITTFQLGVAKYN